MARPNDLLATIGSIYEACMEPTGLNVLAATVAQALGTRSGFLALLERSEENEPTVPQIVGLPSATDNFDEWARTAYADHYHGCNLWFERGLRRGFPAIVLGQELAGTEELVRSEWYEYCRKLDAFHVLGAQFHLNRHLSVQFGAHRPRRSKPFDEVSRQRMAILLPHLQRALLIRLQLGLCDEARMLSFELLERLGMGVLIVDRQRRILFANALADRLLQRQSGLRRSNGRLSPAGGNGSSLRRLIDEAALTSAGQGLGSGATLNLTTDNGRILRLLVSALPRQHDRFGIAVPAVLILISDPSTAVPTPAERLREAFALTRAEAQLLAALASGESSSDYAERAALSIGTVRTHLKHLLHKTGHHRQVDLVRAVAYDPLLRVEA